jgi:hypothetical protein
MFPLKGFRKQLLGVFRTGEFEDSGFPLAFQGAEIPRMFAPFKKNRLPHQQRRQDSELGCRIPAKFLGKMWFQWSMPFCNASASKEIPRISAPHTNHHWAPFE